MIAAGLSLDEGFNWLIIMKVNTPTIRVGNVPL